MQIESFHIQGFKSLADVKVDSLSEINLFYGLNNVGKSNIFEALALWSYLVATQEDVTLKQLEAKFGSHLFYLSGKNKIQLKLNIHLTPQDLPEGETETSAPSDIFEQLSSVEKIQLASTVELKVKNGNPNKPLTISLQNQLQAGRTISPVDLNHLLSLIAPQIHLIRASRRFQIEQWEKDHNLASVSHHNLKQALFYAYLSRNRQQKGRLAAIKRLLAKPPFALGELDVALNRETDEIDIGFVQAEGRLPLENMGSGVQQLLLVLGQIFLDDHAIIAIEEPEMNLSPYYQHYLLAALRDLMQNPDVTLNQLFISTHSPHFEFEETFFDVTINEQGSTSVEKLALEKRERYLPETQVGPQTGARLNSLNQVELYNGIIEDLGLKRGDLVIFTKNTVGRWEIRAENEIIEELNTVTDAQES